MERIQRKFEKFKKALKRFEEIVNSPFFETAFSEEFKIEILIKRFEYLFEALWQFSQAFLRERGVECFSPRSCFEALIKEGIVSEGGEHIAFEIIKLRNTIVHVYDEEIAKDIYNKLKQEKFLNWFLALKKEFEKILKQEEK